MKKHFSQFLGANPARQHFAAHSHHPWPDVTLHAHTQAWQDAAAYIDDKWTYIFNKIIPQAQRHITHHLNLSNPQSLAFAPNTHEFVLRLLSCMDVLPLNIVTTDSEFHSFTRQINRLEETGTVRVTRVAAEPFETFPQRMIDAIHHETPDLLFFSHVFFNSGYVVPDLAHIISHAPKHTLVAVDGYHAFMALPVNLKPLENRIFYLAGGYKYAMAGEGACFMHCPSHYGQRPVNTGWYASFGSLTQAQNHVAYGPDGQRFAGATFDPSGLYRFNASMSLLAAENITPAHIHRHVQTLQAHFLDNLPKSLHKAELIPGKTATQRGHFLTFRMADAELLYHKLHQLNIVTDVRADRLRFGFGIYHDHGAVDMLLNTLQRLEN